MKTKKEQKAKLKEWADTIKQRDKNCVICHKTERLNAHHIIPKEIKELKFDLMNGISLCPNHHRFSREISPHQNPFAFMLWLEKNRPKQFNYLKEKLSEVEDEK